MLAAQCCASVLMCASHPVGIVTLLCSSHLQVDANGLVRFAPHLSLVMRSLTLRFQQDDEDEPEQKQQHQQQQHTARTQHPRGSPSPRTMKHVLPMSARMHESTAPRRRVPAMQQAVVDTHVHSARPTTLSHRMIGSNHPQKQIPRHERRAQVQPTKKANRRRINRESTSSSSSSSSACSLTEVHCPIVHYDRAPPQTGADAMSMLATSNDTSDSTYTSGSTSTSIPTPASASVTLPPSRPSFSSHLDPASVYSSRFASISSPSPASASHAFSAPMSSPSNSTMALRV